VAARLLPYIEQEALYKQINFDKPTTDKDHAEARKTVVKVFLSPDDPLEAVSEDSAATNCLFNAGSKPSLADNDGIFYQDSKIRFADITDGTSNTLMIGETLKGNGKKMAEAVARQHVVLGKDALKEMKDEAGVQDFQDGKNIAGNRCASWMDGDFLQGTFTGTRKANDERPDVNCGGAGGLSGLRSLGDRVNFGYCDGSVRGVKTSVDFKVWKLLTGRNDGGVLPDF
jgi:prepilin-type processing-associated H-X9-DG protein